MKANVLGAAAAVLMSVFSGTYSYAEVQAAIVSKSQLVVGQRYYISADSLNVRSSNSTTADNVVGKLLQNDVVEVYNTLSEATPLVQIVIVKSDNISNGVAPELYISKDYLSKAAVSSSSSSVSNSKYFVIQNIATEKTRIYERCTTSPGCPHKLVMESDTVVGRPEEGEGGDPHALKTWVGHSRIGSWVKFYQDGQQNYPRWYTPGQKIKSIPKPITEGLFGSKRWVALNSKGKLSNYGAFGWYAAKLTPEGEEGVNYQWIHGTIGWGKDGSKPIDMTRGKMINFFSNPGSHGCTRLENRAVAFMRHLLPVGTDVYRVYAREASREAAPYSRYVKSPYRWEYMLLTNGAAQSGGLTADAATIRAQGVAVDASNFIENGIYEVDQYPTVMGIDYTKSASSGKSGDRYSIDKKSNGISNFRGYFLVDEGRFVDYQHPSYSATGGAIRTSGLGDFKNSVPEILKAAPGSFQVPGIVR